MLYPLTKGSLLSARFARLLCQRRTFPNPRNEDPDVYMLNRELAQAGNGSNVRSNYKVTWGLYYRWVRVGVHSAGVISYSDIYNDLGCEDSETRGSDH